MNAVMNILSEKLNIHLLATGQCVTLAKKVNYEYFMAGVPIYVQYQDIKLAQRITVDVLVYVVPVG